MTRDLVQGFIDGYKNAGGDMNNLSASILSWLQSNTQYPTTSEEQQSIISDLGSYKQ